MKSCHKSKTQQNGDGSSLKYSESGVVFNDDSEGGLPPPCQTAPVRLELVLWQPYDVAPMVLIIASPSYGI